MFLRGKRSRFSLVRYCGRILTGKNIKSLGIETEPNILRRDVQHSLGIIGEMVQIRSANLFQQEIMLRKSAEPLCSDILQFILISLGVQDCN